MSSSSIAIRFIKSNPFLEDYLRQGLINYSALSRMILKKFPQASEAAIGMSLRRFSQRDKQHKKLEHAVLKIVSAARVKIENQVSVAIINKPSNYTPIEQFLQHARTRRLECTLIEGSEVITLIFSSQIASLAQELLNNYLVRIRSGFAKIVLTLDERIEETPGVVSFVYGQLSKAGINIYEEMSCWHDIMVVIHERDISRLFSTLVLNNNELENDNLGNNNKSKKRSKKK
jgi:aspartokinase